MLGGQFDDVDSSSRPARSAMMAKPSSDRLSSSTHPPAPRCPGILIACRHAAGALPAALVHPPSRPPPPPPTSPPCASTMAFMVAAPLVRSSVRLASAVTARRAFVGARVAARPAAARVVAAGRAAAASSASSVRMDMEADLRDRLDALYKEKDCMPIMVRLAWHDAGTLGILPSWSFFLFATAVLVFSGRGRAAGVACHLAVGLWRMTGAACVCGRPAS